MTITDRQGNVPEGLGIKAPCAVATTANITLSGLQTVDGVLLVANQRVLVWQQTDQTTNGIYQASTGIWTRPNDANNNESFIKGTEVVVTGGTTNGSQTFSVTCADDPIVIDTALLTWAVLGIGGSRRINTTAPLAGGSSLAADITLTLSAIAPLVVSGGALTVSGLTYAMMQQASASKLLGNASGSAAVVAEITLGATFAFSSTTLRTLSGTGDVTWASNSFATTIANNAVTGGKFRSSIGLSVVGNTSSLAANVVDVAGTASQFLGIASTGSSMGFTTMTGDATLSGGALTIAAASVTLAKMSSLAASSFVGNNTGSATTPLALTLAQSAAMLGSVGGALKSQLKTFTYDLSTASSATAAVTGVGFQPSAIIIFGASVVSGSTSQFWAVGIVDSAKTGGGFTMATFNSTGGVQPLSSALLTIFTDNTTGNLQRATLASFDADGFTLSWVKTGSPTGTGSFYALCLR